LDGEVEKGGEVGDAGRAKVFEVVDGKIVRTKGRGVWGFFDGVNDGSLSERRKGGIERMFVVEFSDDFAGGFVGGVAGNGGKLLVEGVGYVFRGGEDFGTKGDGLVGWGG
jgi:hypothetical protein